MTDRVMRTGPHGSATGAYMLVIGGCRCDLTRRAKVLARTFRAQMVGKKISPRGPTLGRGRWKGGSGRLSLKRSFQRLTY